MNFIDEEYILAVKVGDDGSQVPGALDGWTGGDPDFTLRFGGDDVSQGSLAQPGGTVEKDMVQRFSSAFGCGDGYVQVFLDFVLPDEIIKVAGAQAGIKWYVFSAGFT